MIAMVRWFKMEVLSWTEEGTLAWTTGTREDVRSQQSSGTYTKVKNHCRSKVQLTKAKTRLYSVGWNAKLKGIAKNNCRRAFSPCESSPSRMGRCWFQVESNLVFSFFLSSSTLLKQFFINSVFLKELLPLTILSLQFIICFPVFLGSLIVRVFAIGQLNQISNMQLTQLMLLVGVSPRPQTSLLDLYEFQWLNLKVFRIFSMMIPIGLYCF